MEPDEEEKMFLQWVDEHQLILHKVANAFAAPKDRDDLMQEMLLCLWKAVPRFRGDSRTSTFTYRVVHNCALTWIRGERRRRQREESVVADATTTNTHGNTTDSSLETLYECIRELPPIDRSVITMALDGLRHAEIGNVIGAGESAVSVRIHRIRKKLTQNLQQKLQ